MNNMKQGFTLIEVLVATAIFTMVIIAFISVFVVVAGIQARQTASAAVGDTSQLLLQKIQYYVQSSSYVSTTPDLSVSTLTLRMPSSSIDPTVISLVGGTVYLQQAGGATQPLTPNNVVVSNLSFTRHENPPGHDSVSVAFTVNYNTSNIQQMFSQALDTAVARVSAATFDSGVYPVVSGNGALGSASQAWQSINGVIYFSGTNVGINQASPQQALEVNGGLRLNTALSQPACGASSRGTLWYLELAPSSNDALEVCMENASGTYSWVAL
jgi:prepilin-type N-terminal cleavage/methylation domain-containing protein